MFKTIKSDTAERMIESGEKVDFRRQGRMSRRVLWTAEDGTQWVNHERQWHKVEPREWWYTPVRDANDAKAWEVSR